MWRLVLLERAFRTADARAPLLQPPALFCLCAKLIHLGELCAANQGPKAQCYEGRPGGGHASPPASGSFLILLSVQLTPETNRGGAGGGGLARPLQLPRAQSIEDQALWFPSKCMDPLGWLVVPNRLTPSQEKGKHVLGCSDAPATTFQSRARTTEPPQIRRIPEFPPPHKQGTCLRAARWKVC